ncbi:MAG: hypothetical protein ACI4Q3_09525 [Kiritimatiellia bacterium]
MTREVACGKLARLTFRNRFGRAHAERQYVAEKREARFFAGDRQAGRVDFPKTFPSGLGSRPDIPFPVLHRCASARPDVAGLL